jgi:HK97 family phage major capsid protein
VNDTQFDALVRAADVEEIPSLVRQMGPAEATRAAGRWSAEIARLSRYDKLTAAQNRDFDVAVAVVDAAAQLDDEHRAAQLTRLRSAALGGGNGLKVVPGAFGSEYDRDPIGDPRDTVVRFRGSDPWGAGEVQQFGRTRDAVAGEYRSRALTAIERMPAASDRIRSAATDLLEGHDDENGRLAQLALALSEPTYLRAFARKARDPLGAELDDDERRAVSRVQQFSRAMSLTDSAGGYLVPFQLDPAVIITANGSVNQIRQAARTVVATGDVWNGVSAGAVSWSYDAEAVEVSDDAPAFAQPSIPIFKAAGFVPISYEAMQDAANVTTEVARLLAFGKDTLEASAFAIGSGVGQPTGIVTGLTAAPSSIVATATQDTLALADVYTLHDSLPARYRAKASWLANNLIYSRIRQFGQDLWGELREDRLPRLLGKPVYEAEDMDGTLTASQNNYIAIVGDFAQGYVIADRIGTTLELIPHLFGANRRPTGQRGWYMHVRHGAGLVDAGAFRMLNA